MKAVIDELGLENEIKYFKNGTDFFKYFKAIKKIPFLILCDGNVPKIDGFKIRESVIVDASINYKSVPFIFWSNNVSETQIQKGYELSVHGFFIKGSNSSEMKNFIKIIFDYWRLSLVLTVRLKL